jgi:hypothetical protein
MNRGQRERERKIHKGRERDAREILMGERPKEKCKREKYASGLGMKTRDAHQREERAK